MPNFPRLTESQRNAIGLIDQHVEVVKANAEYVRYLQALKSDFIANPALIDQHWPRIKNLYKRQQSLTSFMLEKGFSIPEIPTPETEQGVAKPAGAAKAALTPIGLGSELGTGTLRHGSPELKRALGLLPLEQLPRDRTSSAHAAGSQTHRSLSGLASPRSRDLLFSSRGRGAAGLQTPRAAAAGSQTHRGGVTSRGTRTQSSHAVVPRKRVAEAMEGDTEDLTHLFESIKEIEILRSAAATGSYSPQHFKYDDHAKELYHDQFDQERVEEIRAQTSKPSFYRLSVIGELPNLHSLMDFVTDGKLDLAFQENMQQMGTSVIIKLLKNVAEEFNKDAHKSSENIIKGKLVLQSLLFEAIKKITFEYDSRQEAELKKIASSDKTPEEKQIARKRLKRAILAEKTAGITALVELVKNKDIDREIRALSEELKELKNQLLDLEDKRRKNQNEGYEKTNIIGSAGRIAFTKEKIEPLEQKIKSKLELIRELYKKTALDGFAEYTDSENKRVGDIMDDMYRTAFSGLDIEAEDKDAILNWYFLSAVTLQVGRKELQEHYGRVLRNLNISSPADMVLRDPTQEEYHYRKTRTTLFLMRDCLSSFDDPLIKPKDITQALDFAVNRGARGRKISSRELQGLNFSVVVDENNFMYFSLGGAREAVIEGGRYSDALLIGKGNYGDIKYALSSGGKAYAIKKETRGMWPVRLSETDTYGMKGGKGAAMDESSPVESQREYQTTVGAGLALTRIEREVVPRDKIASFGRLLAAERDGKRLTQPAAQKLRTTVPPKYFKDPFSRRGQAGIPDTHTVVTTVMELLPGKQDLKEDIEAQERVELARTEQAPLDSLRTRLNMAVSFVEGAQRLRTAGILHLDIKPKNFQGKTTSTGDFYGQHFDFGTSKLFDSEDDYLTQTHDYDITRSGTPEYMAPELYFRAATNFGIISENMVKIKTFQKMKLLQSKYREIYNQDEIGRKKSRVELPEERKICIALLKALKDPSFAADQQLLLKELGLFRSATRSSIPRLTKPENGLAGSLLPHEISLVKSESDELVKYVARKISSELLEDRRRGINFDAKISEATAVLQGVEAQDSAAGGSAAGAAETETRRGLAIVQAGYTADLYSIGASIFGETRAEAYLEVCRLRRGKYPDIHFDYEHERYYKIVERRRDGVYLAQPIDENYKDDGEIFEIQPGQFISIGKDYAEEEPDEKSPAKDSARKGLARKGFESQGLRIIEWAKKLQKKYPDNLQLTGFVEQLMEIRETLLSPNPERRKTKSLEDIVQELKHIQTELLVLQGSSAKAKDAAEVTAHHAKFKLFEEQLDSSSSMGATKEIIDGLTAPKEYDVNSLDVAINGEIDTALNILIKNLQDDDGESLIKNLFTKRIEGLCIDFLLEKTHERSDGREKVNIDSPLIVAIRARKVKAIAAMTNLPARELFKIFSPEYNVGPADNEFVLHYMARENLTESIVDILDKIILRSDPSDRLEHEEKIREKLLQNPVLRTSDISHVYSARYNPLQWAIWHKNDDLIDKYCSILTPENISEYRFKADAVGPNETLFHFAIRERNFSALKKLMDKSGVTYKDLLRTFGSLPAPGISPLVLAFEDNDEVVAGLIEELSGSRTDRTAGASAADIPRVEDEFNEFLANTNNHYRVSPLLLAVKGNNSKLLRVLYKYIDSLPAEEQRNLFQGLTDQHQTHALVYAARNNDFDSFNQIITYALAGLVNVSESGETISIDDENKLEVQEILKKLFFGLLPEGEEFEGQSIFRFVMMDPVRANLHLGTEMYAKLTQLVQLAFGSDAPVLGQQMPNAFKIIETGGIFYTIAATGRLDVLVDVIKAHPEKILDEISYVDRDTNTNLMSKIFAEHSEPKILEILAALANLSVGMDSTNMLTASLFLNTKEPPIKLIVSKGFNFTISVIATLYKNNRKLSEEQCKYIDALLRDSGASAIEWNLLDPFFRERSGATLFDDVSRLKAKPYLVVPRDAHDLDDDALVDKSDSESDSDSTVPRGRLRGHAAAAASDLSDIEDENGVDAVSVSRSSQSNDSDSDTDDTGSIFGSVSPPTSADHARRLSQLNAAQFHDLFRLFDLYMQLRNLEIQKHKPESAGNLAQIEMRVQAITAEIDALEDKLNVEQEQRDHLRSSLGTHKGILLELIRQFHSDIDRLRTSVGAKEGTIERLRAQLTALQGEMAAADVSEASIAKLESRIAAVSRQLSAAIAERDELNGRLFAMTDEHAADISELHENIAAQREQLTAQNEGITKQLRDAEALAASLSAERDAVVAAHDSLRTKLERLQSLHAVLTEETGATLSEEQAAARASIAELEKKIATHAEQIAEKDRKIDESLASITTLREELDASQAARDTLQKLNETLNTELRGLRSELASLVQAHAEELRNKDAKYQELASERNAIQSANDELRARITQADQKRDQTSEELEAAREELANIRGVVGAADDQDVGEVIQELLDNVRRNKAAAIGVLIAAGIENPESLSDEETEEQIKQLGLQYKTQQARIEELEAILLAQEAELERIRATLAERDARIDELESQTSEQAAEIERLTTQITGLRATESDVVADLRSDLALAVDDLEKVRRDAEDERNNASERLAEMTAERDTLQEAIERLGGENERLGTDIEAAQAREDRIREALGLNADDDIIEELGKLSDSATENKKAVIAALQAAGISIVDPENTSIDEIRGHIIRLGSELQKNTRSMIDSQIQLNSNLEKLKRLAIGLDEKESFLIILDGLIRSKDGAVRSLISTLKSELYSAQNQLTLATARADMANGRIESLEKEVEAARALVEQIRASSRETHEQDLGKILAAETEKIDADAALNTAIRELENARRTVADQEDAIASLRGTNEELSELIENYESSFRERDERASERIAAAQALAAEHQAQVAVYKDKAKDAIDAQRLAEGQFSDLKREISRLTSRLDVAHSALEDLRAKNRAEQTRQRALRVSEVEAREKAREVTVNRMQILQGYREYDEGRRNIAAEESADFIRILTTQINIDAKKLDALYAEQSELIAAAAKMTQELDTLQKEYDSLEREKAVLENKVPALETALNTAKAETDKIKEKLTAVEAALEETRRTTSAEYDTLIVERDDLREALIAKEAEKTAAEASLARALGVLSDLENNLAAMAMQITEQDKAIAAANERNITLEESLADLVSREAATAAERDVAQERAAAAEADAVAAEDRAVGAERIAAEANATKDIAVADAASARDEAAAAKELAIAAVAAARDARDEVATAVAEKDAAKELAAEADAARKAAVADAAGARDVATAAEERARVAKVEATAAEEKAAAAEADAVAAEERAAEAVAAAGAAEDRATTALADARAAEERAIAAEDRAAEAVADAAVANAVKDAAIAEKDAAVTAAGVAERTAAEAEGRAAAAEERAGAAVADARDARGEAATAVAEKEAAEEKAAEAEDRAAEAVAAAGAADAAKEAAIAEKDAAVTAAGVAERTAAEAGERATAAEDEARVAEERAAAAVAAAGVAEERATAAEERVRVAKVEATAAEHRAAEAEDRAAEAVAIAREAEERAAMADAERDQALDQRDESLTVAEAAIAERNAAFDERDAVKARAEESLRRAAQLELELDESRSENSDLIEQIQRLGALLRAQVLDSGHNERSQIENEAFQGLSRLYLGMYTSLDGMERMAITSSEEDAFREILASMRRSESSIFTSGEDSIATPRLTTSLLTPLRDSQVDRGRAANQTLKTIEHGIRSQEYKLDSKPDGRISATVQRINPQSNPVATAIEVLLANYIGAMKEGGVPRVYASGDPKLVGLYYLVAEILQNCGLPMEIKDNNIVKTSEATSKDYEDIRTFLRLDPSASNEEIGQTIINYYLLGHVDQANVFGQFLSQSLGYEKQDDRKVISDQLNSGQGLFDCMHSPYRRSIVDNVLATRDKAETLDRKFATKLSEFISMRDKSSSPAVSSPVEHSRRSPSSSSSDGSPAANFMASIRAYSESPSPTRAGQDCRFR